MEIKDLIDHATLPTIVVDNSGFIIHINSLFRLTYGWKKEQLIGNPLSTIIPKELRDAHNMGFSRFLFLEKATILNQSLNLQILHSDGKISDAEHYIIAEKTEKSWQFGATIRLK